MFFGLQPIKQERNSSISGSGGGNVNRFNVSYAPPLPNSKVLTNLKVGAQLTQGEKKQLADELVKFGTSNDRPVRDGQYLKLKALLDYKKDQFNNPLIPQDEKKIIFNEIERLMKIGNQLKFIGAGESGRVQTAATFLGVGYDGIKASAPPVTSPAQSTATSGTTPASNADNNIVTPQAGNVSQPNGVSNVSSEVAADLQGLEQVVSKALAKDRPPTFKQELIDFIASVEPRYQDVLFGAKYKDTFESVIGSNKYPKLNEDFAADVASALNLAPADVKSMESSELLFRLIVNDKRDPSAKVLTETMLGALRKPTGQTESNVESGSQVVPDPSDDGAPIDGVPSEFA